MTDGYMNHGAATWWAVRTEGEPTSYTAAIRDEVRKAGTRFLVSDVESMDSRVVEAQAETRFTLLLISIFSGIAALLAGVGLYGVLSTVVRQRTAEIGLRMALGAAPSSIFGHMVRQGIQLSTIGIVLGVLAAFELTKVMTSMLVGVKATDPTTFASIALLFLLISAAASFLPARRAAALDPTEALRDE